MKGDYTQAPRILPRHIAGDHPQMKGDYTAAFERLREAMLETTPR